MVQMSTGRARSESCDRERFEWSSFLWRERG